MPSAQRWQTCRKCHQPNWRPYDEMVRTGPRHWYHFACYFDAGKSLDDLPPSTIERMPYRLLKDRGLLDRAAQIVNKSGSVYL